MNDLTVKGPKVAKSNYIDISKWIIRNYLNGEEPKGYTQVFESAEAILHHVWMPAEYQENILRGIRLAKKLKGDCIFHKYRVRAEGDRFLLLAK